MKYNTTFKCLHCREEQISDARNRGRQRYCVKPECRKASKARSQRRWISRPENENYFRGAENAERVRQWRLSHPGYWRKKVSCSEDTLQDVCTEQEAHNKVVVIARASDALQDVCMAQPALLVGIISIMTGHALQEEIAMSARSFLTRGQDILRRERQVALSTTP